MDSFELNKIAGAVLGSLLLVLVINEIGNILVHPNHLKQSVLQIDVGAENEVTEEKATQEDSPTLAMVLAEADVQKGAKVSKKCVACHSFVADGKSKIGPALYGVLGRTKASVAGYKYSSALSAIGGDWTYESMDAFLAAPKKYVPGTKMSFAGLKKITDRANLIAYMREHHESPPPLPEK